MSARRPRRRGLGWKWVALAAVLLAGLYVVRTSWRRLHKTYPPNAFYQVKRGDLLVSVREEGALRALNETTVRSELDGYNRIIHLAPEGSYVQKGDLLVELDSSGVRERLNEQELVYQQRLFQVKQAQGNVAIQKLLAESQIKDAEVQVEEAQIDFEKYRDADAPLLIQTIETRSGVLAEQVRIASERAARTGQLFKEGNATRSEVEADALILKREQLALAQYQEDLRLIKKYDRPNQLRLLQSKVEQARAELGRLRQRVTNEIAQAEADLKTSEGALEFVEEGLEQQRRRLANTRILAPQNGLVVYASVSPFQSGGGEERRRDDGRFRGSGRGGGGRSGDGGGGEYRGGGRGGSRGNSDSSSGSRNSVSASAAVDSLAAGNQRIASAQSGSIAVDGADSAGGSSFSGGRSSGGAAAGQGVSSASSSFATYATMRPSSRFGAATATNSSARASSSATELASLGGGQNVAPTTASQMGFRFGGQGWRDFGGYDMPFTPGVLEEGLMVRQRQELIRLPDVSKMVAEIKVEEARAGQVHAGMTAFIEVQNIPHRRFQGTVRRVALLPDAQSSWLNPDKKLFPTDVLVDEELPVLKPGVTATVEIIITNLSRVLSVPIQTVARHNGENVCFVKRGARVVPVPVSPGWFNDVFVEITAGLREGDLVLLAPETDEEEEEPEEGATNQVDAAARPAQAPVTEAPPGNGPRFQRRDEPAPEGRGPAGPPRNRPGQRSQDSPNVP